LYLKLLLYFSSLVSVFANASSFSDLVETTSLGGSAIALADCPASGKYACSLGAIAGGKISHLKMQNAIVVLVVQQNQLFHHAHR